MKKLLQLFLLLTFTGCAGGWTDDDKKGLRTDCLEQSRNQIGEDKAGKYCDCFVESMVKTYPVFNDVMEHYKSDSVEKLKAHCRQQVGLP